MSEVAARKVGEFLHHLKDVSKQRKEEGGPVFPVPHCFVSTWSKAARNRSHVPGEIRSSWTEKLGRERK